MDIINFLPQIAAQLGVAPSTLLFWLWAFTIGSNALARLIPSDAVGTLGVIRKIATITGVYISNRITSGIKADDVQKAAITFPEMQAKVEEIKS